MARVPGSLVGGSATFATAWISQEAAGKREIIQVEVRKRETLYGEFIAECGGMVVTSCADSPALRMPIR